MEIVLKVDQAWIIGKDMLQLGRKLVGMFLLELVPRRIKILEI